MVRITSCKSSDNRISLLFTIFLVINLSVLSECDFKFTKEPTQHTHMLIHTEKNTFSCKVCFRLIPLVCKIIIMQMVHLISFLVKNLFVFTECEFKYTLEPNQHTHMTIHSEEKPSSCSVCVCNSNKQIPLVCKTIIMQMVHLISFLVKNLSVFTECDFKYTLEPNQHTHMTIHSEEKPFSCSVCECNSNKQIIYISIHTGEISTYTNEYNFDYASILIIILLFIMKNNYISNG